MLSRSYLQILIYRFAYVSSVSTQLHSAKL